MRLKKLELTGFKSFAHKTILEFPDTISAIVGPNGSGKSNVVDAVRWVLGEQSLKNLRSKSGVDLIWAGSATKSSQGKASINLHFDNKDGFFPIDFEEVIIGRRVYRDGTNEYYLNDSQVRLKDIAELLARSKLGLRGHSIVNQGSADEMLKSNPEERRSILEESLGLREFQLKKSETEVKLAETAANLVQTSGLIHEISPHLRSLKRQVDKFEKRESIINNLSDLENKFFKIKIGEIFSAIAKNQNTKEVFDAKVTLARKQFEDKEKTIKALAAGFSQVENKSKSFELELETLHRSRYEVNRESGRLEGLIESAKKNNAKNVRTLEAVLAIKIKYWAKRLGAFLAMYDIGEIKENIKHLSQEVETISHHFERNETEKILALADLAELAEEGENPYGKEMEELKIKLSGFENKIKETRDIISKVRSEDGALRENYLNLQKELELSRREYLDFHEAAQQFELEDEKIKLWLTDIKSEMWSSGKDYNEFIKAHFAESSPLTGEAGLVVKEAVFENDVAVLNEVELQNNIIHLRREITDIGSIDEEIIREYEETNKRHEFLIHEVKDLSGATDSLKNLIGDLNNRITNDFKTGITRINEEFNRYFRLMFLGGSAKLTADDLGNREIGVNIHMNMPQKRIKDLNLLSGGERSLVSIALLFAIVSASKPPFLILDEVDAALDEANATRFANVLKDLAKETQFILITHNRSTMEAAKILYGVTMDGDGVSKLFSLKLEEVAS